MHVRTMWLKRLSNIASAFSDWSFLQGLINCEGLKVF
jgi:hypothetical protein